MRFATRAFAFCFAAFALVLGFSFWFLQSMVQQSIREELRTRKEQLLRGAYMEACRNEVQVVNYLAIKLAPGFESK